MPGSFVTRPYRRAWLFAGVFPCALFAPIVIHAEGRSPSAASVKPTLPQCGAKRSVKPPAMPIDSILVLNKRRYDLSKKADLQAFLQAVKDLRALADAEKDTKKAAKKQNPDLVDAEEAEPEEGKGVKGGKDWSIKKVRHGLKAMEMVAKQMQHGELDSATGIRDIQEIHWAVESNFVHPQYVWRKSVDLGDMLFRTRHLTLNAVGRGNSKNPAWDLQTYDAPDLSKVDPLPSAFWSRPPTIATADLYTPYGRKANPDFTDSICTYDGPHKGYGIHPSFEVEWHGSKWKVKFDEERSSGPFGSRIFWALGFPVDIYDYTPEVKVRWDRRILTDFNSRQVNALQVKLIHIPIETMHANRYFNPFDYIRYAVLKDGSRITPQQLRDRCFPVAHDHSRPAHPELKPALYDEAFGAQIDYVVMQAASVTTKEFDDDDDIGGWDYNSLNHDKLREVRGMAVLNAWLDNWDTRWANNRLFVLGEKEGDIRLKEVVSDLGALFGNSDGMVRMVHGKLKSGIYQNVPNDFHWTFTHPQAPGKTTVPIRNYMPVTSVKPFYEMNLDDARWMARMIAQFTEPQIKEALIGAGYDAPVARLLLEKLVSRRDQMVKDFGLSGEFAPLRPHGVDKHLSYDPRVQGAFAMTLPSGEKIAAQDSGAYVLKNGTLKRTREGKPLNRKAVTKNN